MRKNKKKTLFIILLISVLIVLAVGYTYSKYRQSVNISATSAVAKWSFTGSFSDSKHSTVKTISLADTVNSDSILEKRIAPGTNGKFSIVIDATGSEIDLDYDVTVSSETDKPTNLYFLYDGKKYTTLNSLIETVKSDNTKEFSGTILHNSEDKIKTLRKQQRI